MNKRQKEMLKNELKNEKAVLNDIKAVYEQAMQDIEQKIEKMQARISANPEDTAAIYQKQFQQALKKQVSATLDVLNSNQYDKIQDYLQNCYEDAFIGTMYDLQGQGIPLVLPINQEEVVTAIQHDTKLKKPLYEALGYNVDNLKKIIASEISRGFVNGYMYSQIADNIRRHGKVSMNKAYTIARTEGHRITEQARENARQKAKEAGADIVKQWDSTMDKRTRKTHAMLDGQIRELDEPFEVNGHKAMYPGAFGIAKEDINCRCVCLQRAKWALDEELNTIQDRAKFFGLDKSKDFDDFKQKYLKLPKNADKINVRSNDWQGINFSQNYKTKKEAIKALFDKYGIAFSDSRKYPIDEEILCDAVSWMDAFEKEYPNFVKNNPAKLPKLVVKAPSSMNNAVGYFQYYRSGTPIELALNGMYHSNRKYFEDYVKHCIENKWTVANATTRKTFVHEYGHYVSNSMCQMNDKHWEHDFIQECIDEYKKLHPEYIKTTYIGLQKDCDEVSRYGMSSESECFAETFAEYYGGKNPREFAQIFGKKLDKLLKGVKII